MKISTPTVLGVIGRTFIACGILILLFAAFQLWGTGLAESRAQASLEDDFKKKLAQTSTLSNPSMQEAQVADADRETEAQLVKEDPAADLPELGPDEQPAVGEAFGIIEIESIGVSKTFVAGVTRDALRSAPGHYPTTSIPGQPGNAAIAGHRTTYGAPFLNIDKLKPGELIKVTTVQGEFYYEVEAHTDTGTELGHFIVSPDQTEILQDKGDDRLTLTACHPKYSARQRIIVTATLTSAPAPKSVRSENLQSGNDTLASEDLGQNQDVDELGDSLGWQSQESKPTIVWAFISLGIAFLAWFIGDNWRKWSTYILASPLLIFAVFHFFTHLDKLIPAV